MENAVKFKNRTWEIAANVYLPGNFDEQQKYPAIVCVHPGGSVKEQAVSGYASKLAENWLYRYRF